MDEAFNQGRPMRIEIIKRTADRLREIAIQALIDVAQKPENGGHERCKAAQELLSFASGNPQWGAEGPAKGEDAPAPKIPDPADYAGGPMVVEPTGAKATLGVMAFAISSEWGRWFIDQASIIQTGLDGKIRHNISRTSGSHDESDFPPMFTTMATIPEFAKMRARACAKAALRAIVIPPSSVPTDRDCTEGDIQRAWDRVIRHLLEG